MTRTLSLEEITRQVAELADWRHEGGELVGDFTFDDFAGALAFVNRVGEIAEELDHHPDVDIRWNRVRLGLVNHAAGGLTQIDVEAAHRISTVG